MKKVSFYRDWLILPKPEFNILYMLADKGGAFSGTLTDMCNYFHLNPQSKNKNALKNSIECLTQSGYIASEKTGYTYRLQAIPKGEELKVPRKWIDPIFRATSFSRSVGKAQVIKSFVWIYHNNYSDIVINDEVVAELNMSVSTFCEAKNVLDNDFRTIAHDIEVKTLSDGAKRNVGQHLGGLADWSEQKL